MPASGCSRSCRRSAYSGGKGILNKHRPHVRPSFPQTPEVRVLLFLCLLIHPDVAVDLAHVALPHHSDGPAS